MKKGSIKGIIFPLTAAFIWGTAFSAQAICAENLDALSMNALRSLVAALVIFIICLFIRKKKYLGTPRDLILGSLLNGIFLFAASTLQQYGIQYGTPSGKAGFITATYCVIVPILRLFQKKRAGIKVWIALVLVIFGLYFLCIEGKLTFQLSDLLLLGCAFCFAFHILTVDAYTDKVNPIALTCGQFLVTGVLSAVAGMTVGGGLDFSGVKNCLFSLMYMTFFSSCIAYTLQVVSLEDGNPVVTTILYSLESVFAVLAGAVILGETLSAREIFGCILMFVGVVLAETPMTKFKKKAISVAGGIAERSHMVARIKERSEERHIKKENKKQLKIENKQTKKSKNKKGKSKNKTKKGN